MQVILSLNRPIKYMKYGMDGYQYPRRKIVYRMTIRIGGGGGAERVAVAIYSLINLLVLVM